MRRSAILLGASLLLAEPASAQGVGTLRVASGLAAPIFLTAPRDDLDRAFVVERGGRILIARLPDFAVEATPFLTIAGVSASGEGGLLGLAFHPDYATNGYFYVYVTVFAGIAPFESRIVRYQVSADPDVANPASATPVLGFLQPQENHNGGWIGFGPDGYLYIASGDGGSSNDTGSGHTAGTGNAQDITDNLLGKILRIDVDADAFPADPLRSYAIPPTTPSPASSETTRSGSTGCATRGAPASTAGRATSTSATSDRAPARSSTSSPSPVRAARTTAGGCAKA